MLLHQLQYVKYMYHGLTFVFLCVPVLFADNAPSMGDQRTKKQGAREPADILVDI